MGKNSIFEFSAEKSNKYEHIRRTTKDIIERRKRIIRLDERGEKGRLLAGKTAIEATCILGEYRKTVSGLYRESELRDDPTLYNLEGQEEKILTNYAKTVGKWFDRNTIKSKSVIQLASGAEAEVFVYGDEDKRHVVKIVNYKIFSLLPSHFIDNRIALYNALFPETHYELSGFAQDRDVEFAFVLKQPYVEGHELATEILLQQSFSTISLEEELKVFFSERFNLNQQSYGVFTDNEYIIEDAHTRNILRQKNTNKFVVIDAVPSLNTANDEYQGSNYYREFDIIENELPKLFSSPPFEKKPQK